MANDFDKVVDTIDKRFYEATKPLLENPVVSSPFHYIQGDIECIDAIRSALGPEGFDGYCTGNIIKYLWRHKHKGGVEDIQKAGQYIKFLLEKGHK